MEPSENQKYNFALVMILHSVRVRQCVLGEKLLITILVGDEPIELTWDQWEHRVNQGQIASETLVQFAPVTEDTCRVASELEIYTSLVTQSAAAWKDAYRAASPPWMTALLVGVQIRIWWLAVFLILQ